MHSEVRSSIHLMTAKKPVTKVERCRVVKNASTIPHNSDKDADFSTNDFLRRGGTLPSVLPRTEEVDSTIRSRQYSTIKQMGQHIKSKQPLLRRTASVVLHTKKFDDPICKSSNADSEACHQSSCQLEQKVEYLCNKISSVQDTILQKISADSNCYGVWRNITKETPKNVESFSAQDYMFLVLEMNRDIPTKPYDPTDFSE